MGFQVLQEPIGDTGNHLTLKSGFKHTWTSTFSIQTTIKLTGDKRIKEKSCKQLNKKIVTQLSA